MRVWNFSVWFLTFLLFGISFLGTNFIRKTNDVQQVEAKHEAKYEAKHEAKHDRHDAREPRTLPPPKYMVVALHSDVSVFQDIIMQVLPHLTKEWTAWFVSANKPRESQKNWSAVYKSKAYEELISVAHSAVFSSWETEEVGAYIANYFALNHKWWNATPTSIEYIWLVQSDAAVCTTNTKWCIHDFLGWDYLGAAWQQKGPPYGNGGFSIRSRRLQVECTRPAYFRAALVRKINRRPLLLPLFAGRKNEISRCSGGIGAEIFQRIVVREKFWQASWQDRGLRRRHDPLLSRGPEQIQTMGLRHPLWGSSSQRHVPMSHTTECYSCRTDVRDMRASLMVGSSFQRVTSVAIGDIH